MATGRARRVALAAALGVVLLLALAVTQRIAIAAWLLRGVLEGRGLSPVSFEIERLGAEGLAISGLRIGEPADLEIARIEARWTPADLLAARLSSLHVDTLRIRGSVTEDGLGLGALDPLLAPGESAGEPGPLVPALPARRFALENGRIELALPEREGDGGEASGPSTAAFEARIEEAEDGRLEGRAGFRAESPYFEATGEIEVAGTRDALEGSLSVDLLGSEAFEGALSLAGRVSIREERVSAELASAPFALELPGGDGPLRISGETPRVQIEGERIETSGGRVEAPALRFQASDFEIRASVDPETLLPSGRLRIGRVRSTAKPPQIPDLVVTGGFDAGDSGISFELEIGDPERRLALTTRGTHELAGGSGQASLRLEPLVFARGGAQPADLLPLLRGLVDTATGSIEAAGSFTWQGTDVSGGVDLAIRELSLSGELGAVEKLHAPVHLDAPWPFSAPPGQVLSLARVDFGLELTDGLATYRVLPDRTLVLDFAIFRFAGGTIRTSGRFRPGAEKQDFVLEVADVDLSRLFEIVNLEGLSGEGVLDGRIPLTLKPGAIVMKGGHLAAREPGRLRYVPEDGAARAAAGRYGLDVLFAALEDFHYDRLELTLDGDTNGDVIVGLHLAGQNPAYEGGHPVEVNVNIDSRLADLLRKGAAAYRVPAVIEERLEKISAKAMKLGP